MYGGYTPIGSDLVQRKEPFDKRQDAGSSSKEQHNALKTGREQHDKDEEALKVSMGTRLYVGNIPYGTTDLDLRNLFGQNGRAVTEVKIVTDRETGQSRGFAFVEMATKDDALAVIQDLNGAAMGGRSIVVNEARERTPGGGGGGPGGPRPGGFGGGGPGGPRPGGYGGGPGGGGGGYGGPRPGGFGAGPRPGGFGGGPPRPGGFGGGGFGDRRGGGPPPTPEKDSGRRRNRDRDKERERIRDEDDDY